MVFSLEPETNNNRLHWRYAVLGLLLGFTGLVLVMMPTAESIVRVWTESVTYNHGFVILPVSLWLVWQKRRELIQVAPHPVYLPLLLLGVLASLWLVSRLAGIQVIEQFAFVSMLIALSMSVLGWRLSLFLAFPILFLLFAVPMGEELVPPLMDFTAYFTVEAIRLSGIPVYREGLWFVLPSGNWSVVEACSGIRYVIASVTLGFLYAYITYHTLWKRLLFIALSAALPILANGLRAYIIVMIGHLSDMELAVGVDHLVYGWVFFGFVMLLMFWIGGFWAEEHPPIHAKAEPESGTFRHPRHQIIVPILGVLIAVGAQVAFLQASEPLPLARDVLEMPESINPASDAGGALAATYQASDFLLNGSFSDGDKDVQVFIAFYPNQRQGYEAIAKRNSLVRLDRSDEQLSHRRVLARDFGEGGGTVKEHVLVRKSGTTTEKQLVWQWFRIAGKNLHSPYEGKLIEAWARFSMGRSDGAWIAIATPLADDGYEESAARLQGFLDQAYPDAVQAMDAVLGDLR